MTAHSTTFAASLTGGSSGTAGVSQDFVVPTGVTFITVEAWGARGYYDTFGLNLPGYGGYIEALVPVTPGETIRVYVGGTPTSGSVSAGGFNGGGRGGGVLASGGGGGGASDVRRTPYALADRLVVAGGGGGVGIEVGFASTAGGGGYPTGVDGGEHGNPDIAGGRGGTQSAGGAVGSGGNLTPGGVNPTAGALGVGGNGGQSSVNNGGGGGGGGLYGGGGGGWPIGTRFGDGGGGSSGAPGTGVTILDTQTAVSRDGGATNGLVIITYLDPVLDLASLSWRTEG